MRMMGMYTLVFDPSVRPMLTLVESGYLSITGASRHQTGERAAQLADRLRTPGQSLAFMRAFLELREGPLRRIPHWLRISSKYCSDADSARDLREIAELEQSLRGALATDLRELRCYFDEPAFVHRDRRVDEHMRLRRLVPARQEPAIVLAIDLELAYLDRALGATVFHAYQRKLGTNESGRRFMQARATGSTARIVAREARLAQVLGQRSNSLRARSWAQLAARMAHSYMGAVEACVELERRPLN